MGTETGYLRAYLVGVSNRGNVEDTEIDHL